MVVGSLGVNLGKFSKFRVTNGHTSWQFRLIVHNHANKPVMIHN